MAGTLENNLLLQSHKRRVANSHNKQIQRSLDRFKEELAGNQLNHPNGGAPLASSV